MMTNERAISYLSQMYIIQFNEKEHESLTIAIDSIQENAKLKAEIEQLKAELEQSVKFKEYFMELYNQGLEVLNWHLNGDLEPLTNFIDSALEEAEQHLKGKVEE